jgi:hypothetical protein
MVTPIKRQVRRGGAFNMPTGVTVSSNTPNLAAFRNIARVGTSTAQSAHAARGGGGVNGTWPSTSRAPSTPGVARVIDPRTAKPLW